MTGKTEHKLKIACIHGTDMLILVIR